MAKPASIATSSTWSRLSEVKALKNVAGMISSRNFVVVRSCDWATNDCAFAASPCRAPSMPAPGCMTFTTMRPTKSAMVETISK